MGTPLQSPPVYLTLVQVRFNAVLKLQEFLPSIQDAMRRTGFPVYEAHTVIGVQLTVGPEGQATPTPLVRDRYAFGNLEKTHVFWLDADSLTLQSTGYGHFEAFSGAFLEGLALVNNAVGLAYTERIGLRYLDRVFPADAETLSQYLAPAAMGLDGLLGGSTHQSYLETVCNFEAYVLRSRVVLQNSGLAFPPDMNLGGLDVNARLAGYVGQHAILDNDGFLEVREAYSVDSVAKHLDAIHKVIGNAFRATVTPFALAAWDGK